MEEIWKPIKNYPGYDVSNLGRIRSYHIPGRSRGYIHSQPQRIRRIYPGKRYQTVNLTRSNGTQTRIDVHTIVAMAFLGDKPEGLEICHNDGNKQNNRVSNLRYDTHRSNELDAIKHGSKKGKKDFYKRKLGIDILKILLASG